MASDKFLHFPNITDVNVGAAHTETDENTVRGGIYTITYSNGDNEYHSTVGRGLASRYINGTDQSLINGECFITANGAYRLMSRDTIEIRSMGDVVIVGGPSNISGIVDEYYDTLMSGYGSMLSSHQDNREELYLKASGLKKNVGGEVVQDEKLSDEEKKELLSKISMLKVTNVHKDYNTAIADNKKAAKPKESIKKKFLDVIEFITSLPEKLSKALNNAMDEMVNYMIDQTMPYIKKNCHMLTNNMPWLSFHNPYYTYMKEYYKVPIPPSFEDIYKTNIQSVMSDMASETAEDAGKKALEYRKKKDMGTAEIAEKSAKYAVSKFFENSKSTLKKVADSTVLGKEYPPPKKDSDPEKQKILDEYWKRTEEGKTVNGYTYGYVGPLQESAKLKEEESKQHIETIKTDMNANMEALNKSLGYK